MTDLDSPSALDLSELEHLFQLGDYRTLRQRAVPLRRQAQEQDDSEALARIDVLLARLRPDPTGARIYLLALVVLGAITWLTYSGALG